MILNRDFFFFLVGKGLFVVAFVFIFYGKCELFLIPNDYF